MGQETYQGLQIRALQAGVQTWIIAGADATVDMETKSELLQVSSWTMIRCYAQLSLSRLRSYPNFTSRFGTSVQGRAGSVSTYGGTGYPERRSPSYPYSIKSLESLGVHRYLHFTSH